jgi:hypothetical protein
MLANEDPWISFSWLFSLLDAADITIKAHLDNFPVFGWISLESLSSDYQFQQHRGGPESLKYLILQYGNCWKVSAGRWTRRQKDQNQRTNSINLLLLRRFGSECYHKRVLYARRAPQSQGNHRKASATIWYRTLQVLGGLRLNARVCSGREQVEDARQSGRPLISYLTREFRPWSRKCQMHQFGSWARDPTTLHELSSIS